MFSTLGGDRERLGVAEWLAIEMGLTGARRNGDGLRTERNRVHGKYRDSPCDNKIFRGNRG